MLATAEGTRLTGPEIETALNGAKVVYEGARQTFHASGVTDYYTDRPSQGRWAVRSDQYCSTWPPAETWSCYDVMKEVTEDGAFIIWRAPDGSTSKGRIVARID